MPIAHHEGDGCPPGTHEAWTGQSPKPSLKPVYHLDSLNFMDGGIGIAYMAETDARDKGSLIATHTLAIRDGGRYEEALEALRTSVLILLEDALEDFHSLDPDADDDGEEPDDD